MRSCRSPPLCPKSMAEPVSRVAATYVRLLYDYLQAQDIDAERLLGPAPPPDQHYVPLPASVKTLIRQQWASQIKADGKPVYISPNK